MGMYYMGKSVNNWLYDKSITKGHNKSSIKYFNEYKRLWNEFGKLAAILYFIMTVLKLNEVHTLFNSIVKNRTFLSYMVRKLYEHEVGDDWIDAFDRGIKNHEKRLDYVWFITKDHIRLSEYYLYFEEKGYDILKDFNQKEMKVSEHLNYILDDFRKFKEEHKEEINAHMESIKEEKERLENRRKNMRDEKKQSRRKVIEDRSKERKEQREIEKDIKKRKAEERKINGSFNRYYGSTRKDRTRKII